MQSNSYIPRDVSLNIMHVCKEVDDQYNIITVKEKGDQALVDQALVTLVASQCCSPAVCLECECFITTATETTIPAISIGAITIPITVAMLGDPNC